MLRAVAFDAAQQQRMIAAAAPSALRTSTALTRRCASNHDWHCASSRRDVRCSSCPNKSSAGAASSSSNSRAKRARVSMSNEGGLPRPGASAAAISMSGNLFLSSATSNGFQGSPSSIVVELDRGAGRGYGHSCSGTTHCCESIAFRGRCVVEMQLSRWVLQSRVVGLLCRSAFLHNSSCYY